MEITEKKLRQIFMELFDEAFHAVVNPRFDALEKRFDQLEKRFDKLERELKNDILDLKDYVYPRLEEIRIDIKALCQDVTRLTKKGEAGERDLRQTKSVVNLLKKELARATTRLTRFEERLGKLRATPKRKTSR